MNDFCKKELRKENSDNGTWTADGDVHQQIAGPALLACSCDDLGKKGGLCIQKSLWLAPWPFFFLVPNEVGPLLDVSLLGAVMILAKKAVGAAGGASIATFAQSAKLALALIIKIIAVWRKEKFV